MRRNTGRKLNRNGYDYRSTYIQGNVVPMPERGRIDVTPARVLNRSEVRRSRQERLHRKLHIDLVSWIELAVVVAIVVGMAFLCQYYLGVKAQVVAKQRAVMNLQSQVNEATISNKEEYDRIMGSVDLENIKKVAMKELGMGYPDSDQIVEYADNDSDYVRQYEDIKGLDTVR